MDDLWPIFAFAQYYAAENDQEREQIHDRYFYTQRITHTDNQWRIIDHGSELVIETGGKSLFEDNTQWSYQYNNRNDYPGALATITFIGPKPGHYKLHLPQSPKRESSVWGDLTLTASWINHPAQNTTSIQLLTSGQGICRTGDLKISFDINEPLQYDTLTPIFEKGKLTLSTTNNGVTDTATAQINFDEIYIEYNGYDKIWNLRDENRFRYQ